MIILPLNFLINRKKLCAFTCYGLIALAIPIAIGQFSFFSKLGGGHVFLELVERGIPQLPAAHLAQENKVFYGLYAVLGQNVFVCLIFLTSIKWICEKSKCGMVLLSYGSFWAFGILFFSISAQYWGRNPKFPGILLPALLIYSTITLISIILSFLLLGIFKLIEAAFAEDNKT